ncbi:MAG TPA: ribosome maturation factor RimP [Thermoanaerobaculia bacterium]
MNEARKGAGRVAELRPELEQIAEAAGCELVHVEIKGGVLRLILDKPEGVSLGDCEHVSRQVSAFLDVADFGKSRYVLEVSSPGLDRPLYRPRDYERFLGRLARVTVEDPETGKKRTVIGRLQEFERPEGASEEDARVIVVEEPRGERHEIALRNIRQARLEIEL